MTSVTAPLHRFRRWVSMVADQVAAVADAVRAVNRDALVAVLFDQEGTRLVRMARLFTDDRNAAEDIVQEAFIRLHRAAHRLKDPEKAAPYLRSIVVNLARDHNRRGLMSLRHQEAMVSDAVSELPEDLAIANDDHRKIVIELRELSPRQRDCLLLRYYMDLTEVEIADVLGISSNSVKTHCQRGMSALRGPGGGDAMTFEQQVEGALHSADLFQPSPDLFAKVKRSIGEDLAHRSRVRRVLGAVAASVAAVLVYLFVTVDVTSGAWSMSFTALEVLVTVIMIGIVIVLGPAIRRFGETFERDIFRGSPETGTGMLKLLDMSYYLIFGVPPTQDRFLRVRIRDCEARFERHGDDTGAPGAGVVNRMKRGQRRPGLPAHRIGDVGAECGEKLQALTVVLPGAPVDLEFGTGGTLVRICACRFREDVVVEAVTGPWRGFLGGAREEDRQQHVLRSEVAQCGLRYVGTALSARVQRESGQRHRCPCQVGYQLGVGSMPGCRLGDGPDAALKAGDRSGCRRCDSRRADGRRRRRQWCRGGRVCGGKTARWPARRAGRPPGCSTNKEHRHHKCPEHGRTGRAAPTHRAHNGKLGTPCLHADSDSRAGGAAREVIVVHGSTSPFAVNWRSSRWHP